MAMPFVPPLNYTRVKDNRPHRFAYDFGSVDPGMFAPAPDHNRPKRAPRRTVSYTIPLPDDPTTSVQSDDLYGHVLGRETGGVLFSGGRDGVVKAWSLDFPLRETPAANGLSSWSIDRHRLKHAAKPRSSLKTSRILHSDWINDLVVANNGNTITTIGSHLDYRQMIKLWDLSMAGSGPVYPVSEFGDASESSSVYTLACNAAGSLVPVRVWDTRMGKQVTMLSGHTDHIHSELVLSGSSDTTVKLWSMRMRRCLSTFSQHNDSTFYSASRDGLVAKTHHQSLSAAPQSPGYANSGVVCVAVAKEPQGVVKLVAADDSLNRWRDVTVPRGALAPIARANGESGSERSVIGTWQAFTLHPNHHGRHRRTHTADPQGNAESRGQAAVSPVLKAIHAEWVKRGDQYYDANSHGSESRSQSMGTMQHPTSITSVLASHSATPMAIPGRSKAESRRKDTARQNEYEMLSVPESPLPDSSFMKAEVHKAVGSPRQLPQVAAEAVPHGLHRHKILDNKRQVLAQDTRGRVSLWDLLLCCRIYEFPETEEQAKASHMFPGICGRDFESIQMAISTEPESVNTWCHVDTKIGALTVRLDESRVWNAEVHVDEVDGVTDDTLRAMGDHERVNIGNWMLKRLFLPYVRSRSKRGPLSRHDATLLNRWVTQVPTGAVVSAVQNEPPRSAPPEPVSLQAAKAPGSMSPQLSQMATLASVDEELEHQQMLKSRPKASIASQLLATTKQIGIQSAQNDSLLVVPNKVPLAGQASRQSVSYEADGDDEDDCTATLANGGSAKSDGAWSAGQLPNGPAAGRARTTPKLFSQSTYLGSPGHQHTPSIDTAAAPNTTGSATPTAPAQAQQQQQQQQAKADDSESNASNGSSGKFMERLRSMRVRRQKSSPSSHSGQANPTSASNSPSAAPATVAAPASQQPAQPAPPSPPAQQPPQMHTNGSSPTQPKVREKDEFAEWAGPRYPTETERSLALLQHPPAPWDQLYSPTICPRLPLPHNVVIHLSQEHFEASEPYPIYRNTIELMAHPEHNDTSLSLFRLADDPVLSLELCMPAWLTDFLLFNRLPAGHQEPAKLSFILAPSPTTTLAPFPNPNARLVANRNLRARKLAMYVVDKLALPLMQQPAPNYINAVDSCVRAYQGTGTHVDPRTAGSGNPYIDLFVAAGETISEDIMRRKKMQEPVEAVEEYIGRPEMYLDLACKGKTVAPRFTLATIKAHLWKSSNDIMVHYSWAEFVKNRVAKAQSLPAVK
ncbi:hypothetical protein DL89DRAFT_266678 [Linderina pennispora]|uniref:Uncharacterized protein n=1 Tax=Linderina pennispora TaxID=61395 RepID=A0A1Y1WAJ2_9FUNG|nr:uncharacterized protein DL89DRAFT_266678 [Linderina pennispora]ORX70462.1 hypothetical protein DL89DRAFT_266678 [Linderina pennispora]